MGNPLSPLLSDIFMSNFETEILDSHSNMFKFWVRYVDDVFCILEKSKVEECLHILNSKDSSIQFTVEIEKDSRLPYLDLYLERTGDRIELDIYRKPTSTENYIRSDAFNPEAHKTAAIRSMAYRMSRIPLSDGNKKKETDKLFEIGMRNGFEPEKVSKILRKVQQSRNRNKITTLEPEAKEEKKYRKFTFHPKFGHQFRRIFNKFDLELSFNNRFNVANQFSKSIERQEVLDKPGIYEIKCEDCNKVYVGQTKRSIKVRGQEHARNVQNREIQKSAVAEHVWEVGHKVNFVPNLVREVQNKRELDVWENIYIYKKNTFNSDISGTNNMLFKFIKKDKYDNGGNSVRPADQVNKQDMHSTQPAFSTASRDLPLKMRAEPLKRVREN